MAKGGSEADIDIAMKLAPIIPVFEWAADRPEKKIHALLVRLSSIDPCYTPFTYYCHRRQLNA